MKLNHSISLYLTIIVLALLSLSCEKKEWVYTLYYQDQNNNAYGWIVPHGAHNINLTPNECKELRIPDDAELTLIPLSGDPFIVYQHGMPPSGSINLCLKQTTVVH